MMSKWSAIIAFVSLCVASATAQDGRQYKDVVYATVDGKDLGLDIYMPAGVETPPLLVWVHGGAWRSGTKESVPLIFVEQGIATASVDYRLSTEAQFPAAVHDIKAAIRYLRAHAAEYGFRSDRIAIAGSSAGAHLAALVGVTNGHAALEGAVGDHPDQSSSVQAILSYFGASNLTTILSQSTPYGLSVREPALRLFLGALPDSTREKAELASPVFHVDPGDPPLLLFHGDQDPQMPINQSHELKGRYEQLGLDVAFDVVHGAPHGGDAFFSGDYFIHALEFLYRTIGSTAPLPALGQLQDAAAPEMRAAGGTIHAHLDAARETFSGYRAREVVAFVERFWRVPGNRGFNASIERVAEVLEQAGYVAEIGAGDAEPLTYRIERRPMDRPTWDPTDASLQIVGGDTLLEYASNRNMLAINSFSTPPDGVEAEVVYVGDGSAERLEGIDVAGKIVFADMSVNRLFAAAVQERGAIGVLSYDMPAYTQPQRNRDAIQFSRVPLDTERHAWGLRLSFAAREKLLAALDAGPVRLRVHIRTDIYEADELTLVADVHGSSVADERFVFSAHVQEPGANDNASGVGVLAEAARALATLVRDGRYQPERTITMLWGDEISSTRRYLEEDTSRAAGVRWGMSLDMVGENTARTGGTFLIEKMPDPSAVWTRGEDKHTEWGGRPLGIDDLTPHYFNDFTLARCLDQADGAGWVVRTNPYEGGSDHVPFLRAGKPGLLLWHFTDQFYHTDRDRLEMVSAATLENVGVCALTSAMTLADADGITARAIVAELEAAALRRLQSEYELSRTAISAGDDAEEQALIVHTWTNWYVDAIGTARDIEVGGASAETLRVIDEAAARVSAAGEEHLRRLGG